MPKYDKKAIERGKRAPLNLGYVNKFLASWRRATAEQVGEGTMWYWEAQHDIRELAEELNKPFHNIAYAVAALSNQMQWSRNIEVVRQLANGNNAVGMKDPIDKAKACLRGELDALKGPKVNAFALALTGDMSAAVIDRWIMRIVNGRNSKKIAPTQKQYGRITKALEVASKMVGQSVAQFQATIWLQIRST